MKTSDTSCKRDSDNNMIIAKSHCERAFSEITVQSKSVYSFEGVVEPPKLSQLRYNCNTVFMLFSRIGLTEMYVQLHLDPSYLRYPAHPQFQNSSFKLLQYSNISS